MINSFGRSFDVHFGVKSTFRMDKIRVWSNGCHSHFHIANNLRQPSQHIAPSSAASSDTRESLDDPRYCCMTSFSPRLLEDT